MTSIKHRTAALLLAALMGAAGAFVAIAISADEAHATEDPTTSSAWEYVFWVDVY
jgi:hypothetical protein